MDERDKGELILFFVSLFVGALIGILFYSEVGVHLGKQTGNEVCQQLAKYDNNYTQSEIESIKASSGNGELICTVPSYDSTQLIKFKSNSDY